jgi:hypothetical protein|tara:strand:- start:548 stop:775 length:228 start_codon:yes stop_codon:yes gene_type:complete
MLEFDDIELMQLKFCMDQTKSMMAHPSEHMRHASITKKVEDEMNRRREDKGTYTPEYVRLQLEDQLRKLRREMGG